MTDIPSEYHGWWRITETSAWVNDGIDRAIFERLRALGHVKTRELIEAMGGTLPMRTLQRRLQGMVKRGLIEKTGARKDARYRIAEGF